MHMYSIHLNDKSQRNYRAGINYYGIIQVNIRLDNKLEQVQQRRKQGKPSSSSIHQSKVHQNLKLIIVTLK